MKTILTNQTALKYINQIGNIFRDVPHLPKDIVDFLVKIIPWLALVGGGLTCLSTLTAVLGGSAVYRASWLLAGYGPSYSLYLGVVSILALVMSALLIMAFKPLKTQSEVGWLYLFWANTVGVMQSVIGLVLGYGGIVGAALSVVVGLYLLYEIRPQYK